MQWVRIFESVAEAHKRLRENHPQLLLIDGRRVCLVFRDGKIFAVADRCTHNGDSLSRGQVNFLGEVICPWHGYRFDLRTGREANEQSPDLETFPIREDAEGVFIRL
jgi:3-phenylpropionate/trans-cinnamate dioxygenase ferredoxin subunit